jgi:hypothetical protein
MNFTARQPVAMGLKGKRQPDKPFLDIAGGWLSGVASGGCFACPVVDKTAISWSRTGMPRRSRRTAIRDARWI